MVAARRNGWLIPVGSFAVAMLLSIISGPTRHGLARMAQEPTRFDPCHEPTKKDGDDDVGGKSDGNKINTEAAGRASEFGYANNIEWFLRKPTGEVRLFAGAKNGAKAGGVGQKTNRSMRGWKFIHGGGLDCCHTAALRTEILLHTQARVTRPVDAGLSIVDIRVDASVDQFADNCAEGRALKRRLQRVVTLTVLRSRDRSGNLIEVTSGFDSENPNAPNPPLNAQGVATLEVTLKGDDDWFFLKKTEMEFFGGADIKKAVAGPGANQVAEGVAWVFKKSSKYSVADNGTLNQCSN